MGEDISLIVEGLAEIYNVVKGIATFIGQLFQKGASILGFGDSVNNIINRENDFLSIILPYDVLSIIAIGFTVIIAIAIKRGVKN